MLGPLYRLTDIAKSFNFLVEHFIRSLAFVRPKRTMKVIKALQLL